VIWVRLAVLGKSFHATRGIARQARLRGLPP
jgi:hypothetical protein